MRKIMFVHHGYGMGGAVLSLLYTVEALDKKKYDISVLFISKSEAVDLFKRKDINLIVDEKLTDLGHTTGSNLPFFHPLFLYRFLKSFSTYKRFRKILQKVKPDIVHLNGTSLSTYAIAAKKENIKVVWHIREIIAGGWRGEKLRTIINNYSDRIICISKREAEKLIQTEKIEIVYNFVDFKKFDKKIKPFKKYNNIDFSSKKIVLFLGGFWKIKGTDIYVQAAKEVIKKIPNALFLIAGQTSRRDTFTQYRQKIFSFIKENHLEENVKYVGIVKNVPRLIASSDLIVFSSIVPHFPRPLIEAGAMEKPVIASNLAGPDEVVTNGKNGFLVSPENSKELANSIIKILQNKKLAKNMARENYRIAKERFNAEKNIKKIERIYENILKIKE